jgi:UDP-N-acetylmuramoyl-L-alanyl-D-glutamate--2,6-diaminopimelate ligase
VKDTHPKEFVSERSSIINLDDSSYEYLSGISGGRQISYGLSDRAYVWADKIESTPGGTNFTAHGKGWEAPFTCKLVGNYNVSNCLAAIALTVDGMGLPVDAAQRGLANLSGVPGRMEVIDLGQNFTAIVDFAHTPNALKQALATARTLTNGRVIAVFGSAGLRDREKRRMMAEVSAEMADVSILTAEDPRTESLDFILQEMADGALSRGGVEGKTFWRIGDRREAIRAACKMAQPGDLVISCGKGHEQSMCFGEIEYAWDDRTAMKAALAELMGKPGVEMPFLPTEGHG